jgi:hypothetical protein
MKVLAVTVYTSSVTIVLLVTPLLLWMPWLYEYRPTCSDNALRVRSRHYLHAGIMIPAIAFPQHQPSFVSSNCAHSFKGDRGAMHTSPQSIKD